MPTSPREAFTRAATAPPRDDALTFERPYFHGRGSNYLFGYHRLRARWFWRRRVRLVRTLLPHGRLLDVGCAFGFFLALLDGAYEAYGLDISDYAIAQARRILPSPERLQQGDVTAGVPFPEPFDLITAFDVAEHLADPAGALARLAEALRPGGLLVLELPTRSAWIDRDQSHRYHPLSHWTGLLREAGFQVFRTQGFWTIGLRIVLLPAGRRANYHQLIARRESPSSSH